VDELIAIVLRNATLSLLILSAIAAAVAIGMRRGGITFAMVVEELLAYFILCSIAIGFFYNFVVHVFFGEMAAEFIGWADSPFQAEVGFASLGFAAVGLLAFKGNWTVRLAAIIGPACFLWGAAGGHVYQMLTADNFAPGNAGTVFYTDIFLPVIGFVLLALKRATSGPGSQAVGDPSAAC